LLRAHPLITGLLFATITGLIALNAWLMTQRARYEEEIARLRAGMSDVERRRADMVVETEQNRLRVMFELIRRQAAGDKELHLSVAVDSGVMHLERDGVVLREMPVSVAADQRVGVPPDTVRMTAPRGARTIERVLGAKDKWEVPAWVYQLRGLEVPADRHIAGALGAGAIVLSGGAVIYGTPSIGPLGDSTFVLPGAVRVAASDLRAVAPNLSPGMTVYFY
jgi:hypothetical protein